MLPARRAVALWGNPFSSFGWPNELPSNVGDQQRLEASRNFGSLTDLAREYPLRALSKAFTSAYRAILLVAFLAMVLLSLCGRLLDFRRIVWIVTAWLIGRTLFLAAANAFETRYTAPTTPAIELVVALGILILLGQRGRFGVAPIHVPATGPSAS